MEKAELSFQDMGSGVKELILAINDLKELGVENLSIDLPTIVAIGDQSAGKSSVIEAISGVRVPRNQNTCTRCPILIEVCEDPAPDASWSCSITLRTNYNYLGPARRGQRRPVYSIYPHWADNSSPQRSKEFHVTKDKDSIEEFLWRAQVAILNPGTPFTDYITCPMERIHSPHLQVEFSPNIIALKVTGPNLPTLSFVDLPGVIAQADGSSKLPEMVKKVVQQYIKPENCLILLALPMSSDVMNSSASSLVKLLGAQKRCLGVLTKPDLLPVGESPDLWGQLLRGERFQLGHGYFVTRQPSSGELNAPNFNAREKEVDFFITQEPWNTKWAEFKDRFGTFQLQQSLSQKLAAQILSSLPKIEDKIEERLGPINRELRDLPEQQAANASQIVFNAISNFSKMISDDVDGSYPATEFALKKRWGTVKEVFKKDLHALRPLLLSDTPKEFLDQGTGCTSDPSYDGPIEIVSDSDDTTSSARLEATASQNSSPLKRKRDLSPQQGIREMSLSNQRAPTTSDAVSNLKTSYRISQVHQILKDNSSSGLPNESDPRGVEVLIEESLKNWVVPATNLVISVRDLIFFRAREAFDKAFGEHHHTAFYDDSWMIIQDFIHACVQHYNNDKVTLYLRMEQQKPTMENARLWNQIKHEELSVLQTGRVRARTKERLRAIARNARKPDPTWQDIEKALKNQNFINNLGTDPCDLVIDAITKVRAYYQIASDRFLHNIVLSVQCELFEKLKSELPGVLNERLNTKNPESCMGLLVEDREREERRRQLKGQKETLQAAQKRLEDLRAKYRAGEAAFVPDGKRDQEEDSDVEMHGNAEI